MNRRNSLCATMLPMLFADTATPNNLVWVETSFLRQFMSCADLLTDVPATEAIMSHCKYMCSHKNPALHPRNARKGKLLPKDAYDAYINIIQEELRDVVGLELSSRIINDCIIIPTENLFCEDCKQEYASELDTKVKLVKALKFLYDKLEPKDVKISRNLPPNATEDADHPYTYIVSRKFITWYRNRMARFMKQAVNAVNESIVQIDQHMTTTGFASGLDSLDFSYLWNFEKYAMSCGVVEDEGVVVRVNGPLSCESLWSLLLLLPPAPNHCLFQVHTGSSLEVSPVVATFMSVGVCGSL
jgi:hypothetical protein